MDNSKIYSKLCSKIGFAMLLFYAFFTLSAFAIALFDSPYGTPFPTFQREVVREIASAVAYFLSFSAAAFILRRMNKKLPYSRQIYTSFKPSRWLFLFIVAIIAVNFMIAYLNSIMVSSLSPSFSTSVKQGADTLSARQPGEKVVLFIISIVSTAVVPALCEEYLYRGAVLTGLMPYGRTTAIMASSILFGFMHQNPMQLLYTTLMGVVLGYVYIKTKSIWACILIHFFNNLVTVLEEYLPVLTGVKWISNVLDFVIVIVGVIALIVVIAKKDKESQIEENGSFGVVGEIGLDVEEVELGLSRTEKIKGFFSGTVVVYSLICLFSIVQGIASYYNG
ncbi:MAG: CPBP family intramembrane metalloprotease [Clostridia bacterium]|nr:CPBP family intramembrane metalloprotease [Clostridia bacterium]